MDTMNHIAASDSSNSNHGINPMKTKRVKCVIQPSFLYQDGVGDQLQTPFNADNNQRIENLERLQDIPREHSFSAPDGSSDVVISDSRNNDVFDRRGMCHSRGDAKIINSATFGLIESDPNLVEVAPQSSQIIGTAIKESDGSRELRVPEMVKSVAAVEKEIESIGQFVKDSWQRFHGDAEEAMAGDENVKMAAKHPNKAVGKVKKDDKHDVPCMKFSCSHDSRSNAAAGHECVKKKFYDPQDIRKYMTKKKNERREKEKEEKCKKAKEQAALKRKAEVTKMFSNRTKFPSSKGHENQVTKLSDKLKKIKTTRVDRGPADHQSKEGLVAETERVDVRDDTSGKAAVRRRSSRSRSIKSDEPTDTHTRALDSRVDRDLDDIEQTERYFKKRFENIITKCVSEAGKIVDIESLSRAEGSKTLTGSDKEAADFFGDSETLDADVSARLPIELDVLNYKSPYNFLDILKGKVNLARYADSRPADANTDPFITPQARGMNNTPGNNKKDVEDLLRKRQKLTSMVKLHPGQDTQPPLILKSELTLSDLNVSPQKGSNEAFHIWNSKQSDRTFTISAGQDLRRKSVKMYNKNVLLKENRSCALEMSGVKPLVSLKPSASTPLAEKNTIVNLEHPRKHGHDVITVTADEKRDTGLSGCVMESIGVQKVAEGKVELSLSNVNLMKTFSLESLKASNVSFSLPDPWNYVVRDGSGQNEPPLEGHSSSFPTDCTLTGADSDRVHFINNENVSSRAQLVSDDFVNTSASTVLVDLYDQMIKNEDEKLSLILGKIQLQKEALDKHLRSEVFALEFHKNEYREAKAEDKIKAIKKKQRAILLKVTKNILELDKMKKSVIDTVGRRKTELLQQKIAMQGRNALPRQKSATSKSKQNSEGGNRTVIVSNQMNTFFDVSSSSLTSMVVEDEYITDANQPTNFRDELLPSEGELTTHIRENEDIGSEMNSVERKDRATSPVHFNAGISIRLDLDPEKLLQFKNPCAQIKIQSNANVHDGKTLTLDQPKCTGIEYGLSDLSAKDDSISEENDEAVARRKKAIKIKRPASPVVLPSSKKVLHVRRHSSSSDFTLASLNDTTTDQSDVELRICALQEQLKQRKLEAERLRKEEKILRREKLRTKEQSLLKQLEAYDQYIKRLSHLLTGESGCTEVSKPQIKSSRARRQFVDSLHGRKSSTESAVAIAATAAGHEHRLADDAETNTENSDKQLKKADSGILVESEVTEPSENLDLCAKSPADHSSPLDRIESAEERAHTSVGSAVCTEVFSTPDGETPSSVRQPKVPDSGDLLQLVTDLQSEVFSLSEQLYSSDFVEDIPEDVESIPEDEAIGAKLEVSENISNDYNSSMSIEEILSDRRSDADGPLIKEFASAAARVNVGSDRTANSVEPEDRETDPSGYDSQGTIHDQSSTEAEGEVHVEVAHYASGNIGDESRFEPNAVEVQLTNQHEVVESAGLHDDLPSSEAEAELSEADLGLMNSVHIDQPASKSSSDGEVNFFNVKNISDMDSLEQEVARNENQLSEGEVISARLEGDTEPSDDGSIVEEVKSASSLESVADVSKSTPQASDVNESKSSHELLQLNHANESEGSDVSDIEDPVLVADEVQTMMDLAGSLSSEIEHSPSADVEPRFEVVVNAKPPPAELREYESMAATSHDLPKKIDAIEAEPRRVATPRRNEEFVAEYGMEETDVSESLEYDIVPVNSAGDSRLDCDRLVDSLKLEGGFVNGTSDGGFVGDVEPSDGSRRSHGEETSREADRSVEEFVEDYSIPNLLATTFVVNDEECSCRVEPAVSETSREESVLGVNADHDDDLDTMITEDQTPFLQALRRERDSLIAQKQESTDKVEGDLFDTMIEETYANMVGTMGRETSDCESSNVRGGTGAKVEEKLNETLSTDKNTDKFDREWYDKLKFDESRLREAEELRLQQMKIEQEIEELQAQQHIPPYIYLREIPNKPPPPYTPPSTQSTRIPGNEHELRDFIKTTVDYVCDELEKGNKPEEVKLLPDYAKTNKLNRDVAAYKRFLFDLTKEIAREVLRDTNRPECLPWEALSTHKLVKPKMRGDGLREAIDDKISVLFGFRSKRRKEKLIIQWSRKKKTDFVDDLLIQELQDEEGGWTNYEKDELIIKNQIAQRLLNELIEDTVVSLQDAFQKKEQSRE